ncbi:CBS domain-containing protein [Marinobacter sp. CA1]|uniref:CBS domain-containing protein n=1 Tax=Marinobacter sp. CA1 TaxID=2817656 RepID=UPI001D077A48|nr:CBS domain-containing protein [Marinobacter sp. CA1]UDL06395.1 CBS domain-containing protein [Marinobacter sp. CA1]
MSNYYHALTATAAQPSAAIVQPGSHLELTLDDPALILMTDFRQQAPSVIDHDLSVGDARVRMKLADVALKLVVNRSGDCIGLIALKDVLGKRAMARAHQMGRPLEEVRVPDIMQPLSSLPLVRLADLERASVGDVVATFQHQHAEHLVVTDGSANAVVGLISASQVSKRLQIPLDSEVRATSFSDIMAAVQGHFD